MIFNTYDDDIHADDNDVDDDADDDDDHGEDDDSDDDDAHLVQAAPLQEWKCCRELCNTSSQPDWNYHCSMVILLSL